MGAGMFSESWLVDHQAKIARIRSGGSASPVPASVSTPVGCPIAREQAVPKPKRQRPEEELQLATVEFLGWALPDGYRFFHVPNQRGTRSLWENKLLKAMGVKAGFWDVTIITPRASFIAIELKSKDGRLSEDQADWRDYAKRIGLPWFLCRSVDDVIEALESLQIRLRVRA